MNAIALESAGDTINISIPMQLKRRAGRKEIIVPHGLEFASSDKSDYHRSFVTALAQAQRWQALLDSGKYRSTVDLARAVGTGNSYVSRIMRLTLIAPDIIEAILDGHEPDGLSLNKFVRQIPTLWSDQRKMYGFPKKPEITERSIKVSQDFR
jgi:hypothetical protein